MFSVKHQLEAVPLHTNPPVWRFNAGHTRRLSSHLEERDEHYERNNTWPKPHNSIAERVRRLEKVVTNYQLENSKSTRKPDLATTGRGFLIAKL
ncbi:MAG: hypothetical protein HY708_03670 [Ignavibacteriae bacterium]|nr:hypothetical protein [Ignavibacteriota bacterium]